MRNFKFYMSMVMVIGFFISVNSTSFAGERYSIDVEDIKKIAEKSDSGRTADISYNAKIKNNSNDAQTYEVKLNFLNSDNVKIHEDSKVANFDANEMKVISERFNIRSSIINDIDSGYVTISKLKKHVLTADLDNKMDIETSRIPGDLVELAYTVKLRNNTDNAITRNVTVAFFDEDNNKVKSETKKASFHAGESKKITDTLVVNASDADRIATSNVIID